MFQEVRLTREALINYKFQVTECDRIVILNSYAFADKHNDNFNSGEARSIVLWFKVLHSVSKKNK